MEDDIAGVSFVGKTDVTFGFGVEGIAECERILSNRMSIIVRRTLFIVEFFVIWMTIFFS